MVSYLKKFEIKGVVQGVGFRPFIARIAGKNNLTGYVLNDSRGVTLEVEGRTVDINKFIEEIANNPPPLAILDKISLTDEKVSSGIYKKFSIRKSIANSSRQALVAPDSDVCDDCLHELFNSSDRRYKYPFINCTNCGPRYSIIEDIPYDRKNTTMKLFDMCGRCQDEYEDVNNRRFHAEPIACWNCGPKVELYNNDGNKMNVDDPLEEAVKFLKSGKVLAVKGVGGFHLMIDPTNDEAVTKLRNRKGRKEKPFALISENVEMVNSYAYVSDLERKLLKSKQKPIVILKKKNPNVFSENISPLNRNFGVMLAYTPVQYLLLRDNFMALVCTSANISDYPIEYENESAMRRLSSVADYYIIHNRNIKTREDDSIIRADDSENISILRRSRSYAPAPISLFREFPSGLALGSELKNTICINNKANFFLSQHIGDLKNIEIQNAFEDNIAHLEKMLGVVPKFIACDLHPSFFNTHFAMSKQTVPVYKVQHHHAHMASCMAENNLQKEVIAITFDGSGYGEDGNFWGGEFLVGDYQTFSREAHFKYFPLLGGDKAVKEPFRIAIALLIEAFGEKLIDVESLEVICKRKEEYGILTRMARKRINSPLSSSVGRIFDGISALTGVRDVIEYEGQAAIELEQLAEEAGDSIDSYSYEVENEKGMKSISVSPMIREIVKDIKQNISKEIISNKFHNTLVIICDDICNKIRKKKNINDVVLSGGVFQNRYLLINMQKKLELNGFKVYTHSKVPANDGGISLGQAIVGAYKHIQSSNK